MNQSTKNLAWVITSVRSPHMPKFNMGHVGEIALSRGAYFFFLFCDPTFFAHAESQNHTHTHTHTHIHLTALFPGLPGSAGTRKVKPIWILLKQETVSGSGISWDICKSATCCRQITMPAPHPLTDWVEMHIQSASFDTGCLCKFWYPYVSWCRRKLC